MKTAAAPETKASPSFESAYNEMKAALALAKKQHQENTAKREALDKEQARLESVIARAENGLQAMDGLSTKQAPKAKPGPKPAAKKVAAKKTAAKTAAKAAAPKVAKKAAAKKPAAAKAAAKTPAKKAAAKAAAPKAPAAKKAAKKVSAKKATANGKANTSNAAEGRRAVARGDRPPMREAMATVMGKTTMGAAEVVAGLEKKGWMPNAADPQQYVSYMLSSNKEVFERVERGQYKVVEGVVLKRPKAGAGDTAAKKKAPAAKKASSEKKSTDTELGDLGINTGATQSANPFAGQ